MGKGEQAKKKRRPKRTSKPATPRKIKFEDRLLTPEEYGREMGKIYEEGEATLMSPLPKPKRR